jgi:hypothetical protein
MPCFLCRLIFLHLIGLCYKLGASHVPLSESFTTDFELLHQRVAGAFEEPSAIDFFKVAVFSFYFLTAAKNT